MGDFYLRRLPTGHDAGSWLCWWRWWCFFEPLNGEERGPHPTLKYKWESGRGSHPILKACGRWAILCFRATPFRTWPRVRWSEGGGSLKTSRGGQFFWSRGGTQIHSWGGMRGEQTTKFSPGRQRQSKLLFLMFLLVFPKNTFSHF